MKEQIKKLFAQLNVDEQTEILKELSSNSTTSMTIAEFATKHQKQYGTNVEFDVKQSGLDHSPVITATVHTGFGDFKGTGNNQKIAKAKAVEEAFNNWR